MTDKFSYAKLEKNFVRDLRLKVSQSENTTDVISSFSHVSGAFLRKVINEDFDLYDDDIIFDPSAKSKYRFSNRLMNNKAFANMVADSDIGRIIGSFAETAEHRYIHLSKHPLKSDLKIRK